MTVNVVNKGKKIKLDIQISMLICPNIGITVLSL